MRFLIVFAVLVLAQPAFAEDEFGARFGTSSTVGFEDVTTSPEDALSKIAPAAGEEEPATTSEDQPQNASDNAQDKPEGQTHINELR